MTRTYGTNRMRRAVAVACLAVVALAGAAPGAGCRSVARATSTPDADELTLDGNWLAMFRYLVAVHVRLASEAPRLPGRCAALAEPTGAAPGETARGCFRALQRTQVGLLATLIERIDALEASRRTDDTGVTTTAAWAARVEAPIGALRHRITPLHAALSTGDVAELSRTLESAPWRRYLVTGSLRRKVEDLERRASDLRGEYAHAAQALASFDGLRRWIIRRDGPPPPASRVARALWRRLRAGGFDVPPDGAAHLARFAEGVATFSTRQRRRMREDPDVDLRALTRNLELQLDALDTAVRAGMWMGFVDALDAADEALPRRRGRKATPAPAPAPRDPPTLLSPCDFVLGTLCG